jgi:hypothetical protein
VLSFVLASTSMGYIDTWRICASRDARQQSLLP